MAGERQHNDSTNVNNEVIRRGAATGIVKISFVLVRPG